MTRKTLMLSVALFLGATAAHAQIDPQALANDYFQQGYSRVEITVGPGDVKVEAINGATQVEVVYDRATGAIISRESGPASLRDQFRTGLEIRERDRNAVRGSGSDDDGSDDDSSDDDSSDDDNDSHHSGGSHGSDDDHGGHGGDDHDDDGPGDDHGGHGSDDGPGDDHGDHGPDHD